jgi:hypothetical protein
MIVRVLGQGQWQVDDLLADYLNEIDDQVVDAVDKGDQEALTAALTALVDHVVSHGEELPDDGLEASDVVIPDSAASVDEVRELLETSPGGLIPE